MIKKTVISNPTAARMVLRDPRFASNRIKEKLSTKSYETTTAERVAAFLSSWPMYQDGVRHGHGRDEVVQALRSCTTSRYPHHVTTSYADNIDLGMLVSEWHRELLGIGSAKYRNLVPLIELTSRVISGTASQTEACLMLQAIDGYRIRDVMRRSARGSVLYWLERRHVDCGLVWNVILDSFFPVMRAAERLRDLIESLWDSNEIDSEAILRRCLCENPPFGTISRLGLNSQDEVVIDVGKCSQSVGKGYALVFGFGPHACPGAGIALDFLKPLARLLVENMLLSNSLKMKDGL